MRVSFSPIRWDADLHLYKSGDTLTINGDVLDFSDLPNGGEYPPTSIDNPFVIGGVSRLDGVIHITVLLPYSNPDAPAEVIFPKPIEVTTDGDIVLPAGRTVEVDDAD